MKEKLLFLALSLALAVATLAFVVWAEVKLSG